MKKILSSLLLGISLLFASIGVIGATSANQYQEVDAYRNTVASCWVNSVVGSGYGSHSNDDWLVTFGESGKIRANTDEMPNCNLASYPKYADGTNIATSDKASAVANLKSLSGITKITIDCQGVNISGNTEVYINYSPDNVTFSPLELDYDSSSSQGDKLVQKVTSSFSFPECDGYFAIIFKYVGDNDVWRIDDAVISFDSGLIPELYLNKEFISGREDDEFLLETTWKDFYGDPSFTWTVEGGMSAEVYAENDPSTATVTIVYSQSIEPPIIVVTATYEEQVATARCTVRVYDKHPESIAVTDPSGATSGTGILKDKIQLTSTVNPSNADPLVTWSSSNEEVATVDENGLVSCVAIGEAKIIATSVVEKVSVSGEYALTVSGNLTYEMVTDLDSLVLGNSYTLVSSAIGATSGPYAMSTTYDRNPKGTIVGVTDNRFSVTDGFTTVARLILVAGIYPGSYAFYDFANGGYLYAPSSSSDNLWLEETLTLNSSFTIELQNDAIGKIAAKAQGDSTYKVISFDSSTTRFTCYKSVQTNDYIMLYEATGVANEGTANKWASDFLTASSEVCSETADLENPDRLMRKCPIDSLSIYAQDILKHATSTNAAGDLASALARYDFIVNKYTSCIDNLGRRTETAGSGLFSFGDNGSDIILGVILVTSLTLVSGLFFLGKRRTKKKDL